MGDFGRLVQLQLDELRDAIVAQHVKELEAIQKDLRELKQKLDNSGGNQTPLPSSEASQLKARVPQQANPTAHRHFTPTASLSNGGLWKSDGTEEDKGPMLGRGSHAKNAELAVDNPQTVSQRASLPNRNSSAERYTVKEFWVSKYQLLQSCSTVVTHRSARVVGSSKARVCRVGAMSLSTAAFTGRHTGQCRFILDPDSFMYNLWQWLRILLLVYDLMYIPVDLAFDVPENTWSNTMTWIATLFWTADMVVSSFTGVYINGQKEMRFQRILCRYTRTWLSFDVIIVGTDWTMVLISSGSAQRSFSLLRIFRFLRVARLLRLRKFMKTFSDLAARLSSEMPRRISVVGDCILMFLNLAITFHFLSCVWYGLGKSIDASWVRVASAPDKVIYNYLTSMQLSLTLLHESNQAHLDTAAERGLACATAFVTVIVYSMIVARTAYAVFAAKNSKAAKILAISWRFRKAKRIPPSLATRVQQYLQAQQGEGICEELTNEHMFMEILPETLQIDLHAEVRTPLLSSVQFFNDMQSYNPRILRKLCHVALAEMVVLERDAVFAAGDSCTGMFFVTRGYLSYLRGTQEQLCFRVAKAIASESDTRRSESEAMPVEEGMRLCEPALWTTWEHKGDLTAAKDSLLLVLSADSLEESVRGHHSASIHALKYARHFVWCLNHGEEPVDSDIVDVCLPIACLDNELFAGSEDHHFIFISHFKKESGTEATLMSVDLEHMIRGDPSNAASEFRHPVFLDSENLRDLATLSSHVKKSRHLLLLLTPGVLSRPWCLVELVHAVRHRVEVVPVEVHKPGTVFEYPTQSYYDKLLAGEILSPEALRLLDVEDIRLQELVFCLRTVFNKIALSFSPHRPLNIRQAELTEILAACEPIHWAERIESVADDTSRVGSKSSLCL